MRTYVNVKCDNSMILLAIPSTKADGITDEAAS